MYPDYTPPEQKKTRRIIAVVCACVAALFVILLISALRPKETFQQAWIHKTDLSYDQNFTYLNGSTLYAYNGLAFYATTREGDVSVLSAKYRLPNPEKIYWANDQGALMTFSSGFYYSQIETELKKRGQSLGEATIQDYTWYLDFATNSFHLVTPEKAESTYYSSKDRGFYYFTGTGNTPRLHFYDAATYKDKIVAEIPNIVDISNLTQCTGTTACFVARDKNVPAAARLYEVKSNGTVTQMYDSKGRIFPTNKPDKYVVVETTKEDNYTDASYDEADFPETPAYLYDAGSKSLRGLGFEVGATPVTLHMLNDTEFYAFGEQFVTAYNDQKEVPAYEAGRFKSKGDAKTALMPLLYSDGSSFDSNLVAQLSQGGDKTTLLSDADQRQYLFDFNQKGKDIRAVTELAADTNVKSCIKSAGLANRDHYPEQKLFRIVFNDTPGFQNKIAAFSSCLTKTSDSPIVGYTYTFVGVDPTYDRIVTD